MILFTLLAKRQRALADHGWLSILVVATAVVLGSQACNRGTLSSGSAPDAAAGASGGAATGGVQATGGAGGTEASATGGSSANAGSTATGTKPINNDAAADASAGNGGNGGSGGSGGGGGEAKPDAPVTTGTGGAGASGGVSSSSGAGGASSTGPTAEPLWPDLVGTLNLPECSDGGQPSNPLHVNPSSPIDYIAFCEVTFSSPKGDGGTDVSYRILEMSGTACKGAVDASTCAAELSAVANNIKTGEQCGGPPYGCQHFVVTTAGSTVRAYLPSEYKTLLGTIDTADEARLLTNQMTFQGWSVQSCGSIRATESGYDVVATRLTKDCAPIVYTRDQLHVAPDGTVTVVRSNIAYVSGACI